MIKNNTQLKHTKKHLTDFLNAKIEFELENDKDSVKYKIGVNSLNSMIDDLSHQIKEYENLQKDLVIMKSRRLYRFSDTLIASRIAKGWTQTQLAEKLGIDTQQIQRYESSNYESASHLRMIEVALALELNLVFKDFQILKQSYKDKISKNLPFEFEKFKTEKTKITKEHSLFPI